MQFFSLLYKNMTLWRRGYIGTTCEFCTPIFFALCLMLFGTLKTVTDHVGKSYLDSSYHFYPNETRAAQSYPDNYKNQLIELNKFKKLMKQCNFVGGDENNDADKGLVALAPSTNPVIIKLDEFFKSAGFETKSYKDFDDMSSFVKSGSYGSLLRKETINGKSVDIKDQICFGISFEETQVDKYEYNVHFNTTKRRGNYEVYPFNDPQIIPFEKEAKEQVDFNLNNGLPFLQNLIDTLILRQASGNINDNSIYIKTKLVRTPVDSYKTSNIYDIGEGSVGLFTIFIHLIILLRFTYSITSEKEARITENMRNMGMNMFSHYMSWLMWYGFTFFLTSIPWVIIMKLSIFPNVNFFAVWFIYLLPGFTMIALGFFISAFFTRAKPAVLAALIAFFILYGASIGQDSIANLNTFQNVLFSLSPISGVFIVAKMLLITQTNYAGFGIGTAFDEFFNYRYYFFVLICVVEYYVLVILGMYFDQVFPSEIGVRRHPLFCVGMKNKGTKATEDLNKVQPEEDDKAKKGNFEEVGQNLKSQKANKTTLEIKNLYKIYPNGKKAVNNLTLDMFSNQIFALLGHNGAGKTTTISMISGLLPISTGDISVFGYDTRSSMDKVKELMGVCPQKNPIYTSLTVYEHLYLYAKIKGAKGTKKEINEQIDEILSDIDLLDKKNYFAGMLSGGQKRKLCVAISFIGGSKVILLDEPTSGMDTYARRKLWDMLKKYKKDKIIILTTHYMDEADYLGDRIGIMGDGELLTCGTPLFLKNKFGVGYNLTVVKSGSDIPTDKLTKAIEGVVKGSKLEGDIGKELKYQLPQDQSTNFETLFKMLEDQKTEYGVESFGISLTTLEEVFLKVAVGLGKHESIDHKKEEIYAGEEEEEVELKNIRIQSFFQLFFIHFYALTMKRLIYFRRDWKSLICEIILPILIIGLGLSTTLIQIIKTPVSGVFTPSLFEKNFDLWVSGDTSAVLTTNLKAYSAMSLVEKTSTSLTEFDTLLLQNFDENRFISAYINKLDVATKAYDYNLFYNSSIPNSIFVGQNVINDAFLKEMKGTSASIIMNNQPLPLTEQTSSFNGSIAGFFSIFFFTLAYAFIPSSNIMFIVHEREANVKHQQLVSGVGLLAYWLSNLVIDYAKFLIVGVATFAFVLIYWVEVFIDDSNYTMTILLILTFGLSNQAFTYVLSFYFKSPSSAQIAIFLLNFFFGLVMLIASFVLRIIDSTRNIHFNGTEYILRLFPIFNFSFGLLGMAYSQIFKLVFDLDDTPGAWSYYGSIKELIASVLTFGFYFSLIFAIETFNGFNCFKKKNPAAFQQVEGDVEELFLDDDVLEEEKLVKNAKPGELSIKVQDLTKTFAMVEGGCIGGKAIKYKRAVKGVNFGVAPGDCFGLLGTNGAGKTTTFKMLSGELSSSTGFAEIEGMDVATQMKKIRYLIGYCPQFDALLDKLTSRQHLELYAAIKGIPYHLRDKLIKEKLVQLNLTNFEHVQAGTYSGGNKRKLSVAIALLGNPPIVFLDEPSSGMDPEARRFMWSVVSRVSSQTKKSSIILTTHSMEEAEALSTKLAIMVEGQIKCIGPVQKLKNKYGKGFEIETKLNLPTYQQAIKIAEKCGLPAPSQRDEYGESIKVEAKVSMEKINAAFTKLGKGVYSEKIQAQGEGSIIFNEIKNKKEVAVNLVLEFIHLQDLVSDILAFLQGKFGNVSVLESYLTNYKFKVEDNVKLSTLFGEMERHKDSLSVGQYSVKQTSIEQIFMSFANERIADEQAQIPQVQLFLQIKR